MTALPQPMPATTFDHPLTVAEFTALPEDSDVRLELQEGSVVLSPRPVFRHQKCINRRALTACHLGGEFGYVDAQPVKGVFVTDTPFPARVDLTNLV